MELFGNRSSRWLGVVALGIAVAAPAVAEDLWKSFESKKGQFSVEVPGEPILTTTKNKSFVGTITNHIFTVLDEETFQKYTIDYSEVPSFAVEFTGADVIIDHAKGALLKETLSKPTSFEEITVAGKKGKKLVYQTPPVKDLPGLRGEAIFILRGDRLYVLDVQVPLEDSGERASRFLGSLDFID